MLVWVFSAFMGQQSWHRFCFAAEMPPRGTLPSPSAFSRLSRGRGLKGCKSGALGAPPWIAADLHQGPLTPLISSRRSRKIKPRPDPQPGKYFKF